MKYIIEYIKYIGPAFSGRAWYSFSSHAWSSFQIGAGIALQGLITQVYHIMNETIHTILNSEAMDILNSGPTGIHHTSTHTRARLHRYPRTRCGGIYIYRERERDIHISKISEFQDNTCVLCVLGCDQRMCALWHCTLCYLALFQCSACMYMH